MLKRYNNFKVNEASKEEEEANAMLDKYLEEQKKKEERASRAKDISNRFKSDKEEDSVFKSNWDDELEDDSTNKKEGKRTYDFWIGDQDDRYILKTGLHYMILVFPHDRDDDDWDDIGMHSPDIPEVLNPIGIHVEEAENCFAYYPKGSKYLPKNYIKGMSKEDLRKYLESHGWTYNKDLSY